jgi:ankyrin repeat protein
MARQKEFTLMKSYINRDLVQACKIGKVEIVKKLLKQPNINLSYDDGFAFQCAVYYGHDDIVKLLLADKRLDPTLDNNFAICWASENPHSEKCIKLILEDGRIDPSENGNEPLYNACLKNNYDIVNILLQDQRVDPFDRNGSIIDLVTNNNLIYLFIKYDYIVQKLYKVYFEKYKNIQFNHIPKFVITLLKKAFKINTNDELENILKIF